MGQLQVRRIYVSGVLPVPKWQVERIFASGSTSLVKPQMRVQRIAVVGSQNSANAGGDLDQLEPGTTQVLNGSGTVGGSTFEWVVESYTGMGAGQGIVITNANQKNASYVVPKTTEGGVAVFKLTVDGTTVSRATHSILPWIDWYYDGSQWHPVGA